MSAAHAPFSMALRLQIAQQMLGCFAPLNNANVRGLLGLPGTVDVEPLSMQNFLDWLAKSGLVADPYTVAYQISSIADRLVAAGFLQRMAGLSLPPPFGSTYYAIHGGSTKAQASGWLWLSEPLGDGFVVRSYLPRTVQITGEGADGNPTCGTGLLLDNEHILTNSHVVTDMALDRVLWTPAAPPVDSTEATVEPIELTVTGQDWHKPADEFSGANPLDVGIVKVTGLGNLHADYGGVAFRDPQWADAAWSFGYPPVPQAAEPAVVVHSGQVVNPKVQNQRRNDMMLFSATARPGNSGGPIVAQDGRVIGIVAEDLGKMDSAEAPFYAGVPTHEIARALVEMGYPTLLNIETWESR